MLRQYDPYNVPRLSPLLHAVQYDKCGLLVLSVIANGLVNKYMAGFEPYVYKR